MDPTDPRKPHPTPPWMRVGVALTVLVCAFASFIAGLFWWSDVQGKRAWEAYRREALARGVKLDLKDFITPPVPDEENVNFGPSPASNVSRRRSTACSTVLGTAVASNVSARD